MDKSALLVHLTRFHQQVLDEMYAVTHVRASPAEIRIRPWLHAEASWGRKTDMPKQGFIIINEAVANPSEDLYSSPLSYSSDAITQKEQVLIHETGHHLHAQTDSVWQEFDLHPHSLQQKTLFEKRFHRYDELVAEFFTCCFYERQNALSAFLGSQRGKDLFYSQIHALYCTIPQRLDEREHTLQWLITHAYTDVRRQFHRTETLQRIGEFVNNVER